MSSNRGEWLEILAYPASKVADAIVSDVHGSLGARGCLILLVGGVSLLLWVIPPFFLGEDAQAWLLCVGPLATLAVIYMTVSQFGLLRRHTEDDGSEVGRHSGGAADGGEQPAECPFCGAPNPSDSLYCGECSARLGGGGAEAPGAGGAG